MKMKVFAILAFCASQALTQSAFASDGTMTINGKITAATCVVSGNGAATGTFTLTLPTVSTTALNVAGATAGHTLFNIALSACSTPSQLVHTYFEAASTADAVTGRLYNAASATATNVEVALMNKDRTAILVGFPDSTQNSNAITTVSNAGTMYYIAAYYANGGASTAGTVASTVSYSVVYP
ncbi:fimbrial protein [Glaciimonas sp. PAMC28666]|uniref:fimbrial protein n=1 Tax=Glaciimonas sp. PAMC28666 TaxID=2807626 RepID=UPI001963F5C3|nr:fimbrial protein [Glaciimonas sp. PAMC28666]QRX83427.1 type 1 fimbrial protein [Glaciimonas sp. PAMC28666]